MLCVVEISHSAVFCSDQSQCCVCVVEISHRFSQCCGKNITLRNNGCIANRVRHFNGGLVFSADPLRSDELFEVRVYKECNFTVIALAAALYYLLLTVLLIIIIGD